MSGRPRIGVLKASSQRRFEEHKPVGSPMELADNHPAVRLGTTLFTRRVMTPRRGYDHVLKSGHNNRKIGRRVAKGRLKGMEIYTLTLEERATCPRSCEEWSRCYGNKMQWPSRWQHGKRLEDCLDAELRWLARHHRRGFLVRLHVLGDFYSLAYVARWLEWMIELPQLHVFGYTAWPPTSPIGRALLMISRHHWNRFAIRFSNSGMPTMATRTRYETDLRGRTNDGIVCPAQTGDSDCCAVCALCWQTRTNIVFLGH